jgi:hypothetical protein
MDRRGKIRCAAGAVTVAMLAVAAATWAEMPTYSHYQLQARANFSGAYQLPNSAFFANATILLNDELEVAIRLDVVPGTDQDALWFGRNGAGSIVRYSPDGALISSPNMNNNGRIVYEQIFSSNDGLYYHDGRTGMGGLLTKRPLGASGWGSPGVNSANEVGYRASFLGDYAFVSYAGETNPPVHAAMVDIEPSSPYSFLFTPSFNELRQIAGKVRLGAAGQTGNSQPDEIRVFNVDGSSTLIVEDRDGDAGSPFLGFDNSVFLTDVGLVAFNADVSGGRGVYISDGTTTTPIALTSGPDISNLEFFAPAANNRGMVAFRAFDETGLRAVWAGDGTTLRRIATEHDIVPSDLGPARIDQETTSSPVFGGGVSINECGDVTFHCGLAPPENNQVEWGSGAYVAYASRTADTDYDCDGDVDLRDYRYFADCFSGPGASPKPALSPDFICTGKFDTDADGDVDLADYAALQRGGF